MPSEKPVSRVHVQTTLHTVFGTVDEDGNLIPDEPATIQVHRFTREAFEEAFEVLRKFREEQR